MPFTGREEHVEDGISVQRNSTLQKGMQKPSKTFVSTSMHIKYYCDVNKYDCYGS